MLRTVVFAALFCFLSRPPLAQDGRSVLRLTVAVMDEAGKAVPVPRHVLLVSDEPPTSAPRPVRTAADGTASVRLPPGRYTVESEQPFRLQAKTYEWRQTIEIAAGRDAVLELTPANADTSGVSADTSDAVSASAKVDASSLLARWQNSVVGVWSPIARASGVIVDVRGVIVTSHDVVGSAATAEVELTSSTKVPARVIETDQARGVAVLWIDPAAVVPAAPVPTGCAQGALSIADGQEIAAIGAPIGGGKRTTSGSVEEIEGRTFVAGFGLAADHAGGAVFAADGRLLGILASMGEDESHRRAESRVVRVEEVCAAVASAELKMKEGAPPASRLPIEPERPFPREALEKAAQQAGDLDSYRLSSSSYDVTFITPPLLYAAERRAKQAKARDRAGLGTADPRTIDPLDHFSNWSAYVAALPPVLMIRATPKLAEGFWTRVARGAAQTQGVSIPPIKRFKPGFGRLQAFCGPVEVTPIHALRIEQRVSETDAVYEGLYVFDPGAFGPACGSVKLVFYSEKEPRNADTRVVHPRLIDQIWSDFAPYRAMKPE